MLTHTHTHTHTHTQVGEQILTVQGERDGGGVLVWKPAHTCSMPSRAMATIYIDLY